MPSQEALVSLHQLLPGLKVTYILPTLLFLDPAYDGLLGSVTEPDVCHLKETKQMP